MAAPKRTQFEIARDHADIAGMYLRGMNQWEIAKALASDPERKYELSRQSISRDLKLIKSRWVQMSVASIAELKARELAKLDELERESWRAWERSTQERKKTRTGRKVTGGLQAVADQRTAGPSKQAQADTVDVWREEQQGDPRFLTTVMDCIDRRCKLLGLDAPQKHEWQNIVERIPWEALSPAQMRRLAAGEALDKVIPGFNLN